MQAGRELAAKDEKDGRNKKNDDSEMVRANSMVSHEVSHEELRVKLQHGMSFVICEHKHTCRTHKASVLARVSTPSATVY